MNLVDRPPLSAAAAHLAGATANMTYYELFAGALEPFCIVPVNPHTLLIDRSGFPPTISDDSETCAPI